MPIENINAVGQLEHFIIDDEGVRTEFKGISNIELSSDDVIECKPLFSVDHTLSFESVLETILQTPDGSYITPTQMIISIPHLVQNRIHKKKRINKKWAKRYGFREVNYEYTFDCNKKLEENKYEYEAVLLRKEKL